MAPPGRAAGGAGKKSEKRAGRRRVSGSVRGRCRGGGARPRDTPTPPGARVMRVAYLTTDEVNAALAREFAAGSGLDVCLVPPLDRPTDPEFVGAVYDLDFLPPGRLGGLLVDLGRGPLPYPVAVHS